MKPQAMTGTAAADAQPDSQVLPSGTPRLPTGKATLPLVHTTPKETAAHHEPACLLTSMHNSRRTPREQRQYGRPTYLASDRLPFGQRREEFLITAR